MAFLEGLIEWAMGLVGIFGVLILLLILGACIVYLGIFMVLIPGALLEVFPHDSNFKLVPRRVALVIGGLVGLFLIRWYLPFAIAGAVGLIAMVIELTGTSW